MNVDQQLMHYLKRACASSRRHLHGFHGHHPPNRGFGHILEFLTQNDGVSQQLIADALELRPQSVCEAITVLEERGYIRKENSAKDRRVTLIYLTEPGRIRAAELAQERKEHAEWFFSVLSSKEKAELLALLTKRNGERMCDE